MSKNDPAFPVAYEFEHAVAGPMVYTANGLTKRKWFAGMAMQGQLANADIVTALSKQLEHGSHVIALITRSAYEYADAMLESQSEAEDNNDAPSSE